MTSEMLNQQELAGEMNLHEQQAKAWKLAPDDAQWITQAVTNVWWSMDKDRRLMTKLFKGTVNGWDWRDTLQSREGFEAMNKEQWMPEVGQECEVRLPVGGSEWQQARIIALGDLMALVVVGGSETACIQSNMRPIQSEADKYRDEQIQKLHSLMDFADLTTAEELFNNNVRVLSPDERICKPLTDEQVNKILLSYNAEHHWAMRQAIDAVQREQGVIEEEEEVK